MQALLNAIAQMSLSEDAQRVFHGRGGMYPGCEQWSLDWFAPVWVLTSFKPVSDQEFAACHIALQARWETLAPGQPLNWAFQSRVTGEAETRIMAGSLPEQHLASEAGPRVLRQLIGGQEHGTFVDIGRVTGSLQI